MVSTKKNFTLYKIKRLCFNMYKLIDNSTGSTCNITEKEIVVFLQSKLSINNAYELNIEEMEEILHYQNYTLERE